MSISPVGRAKPDTLDGRKASLSLSYVRLWFRCWQGNHHTGLARRQPCRRKVCRVTWRCDCKHGPGLRLQKEGLP